MNNTTESQITSVIPRHRMRPKFKNLHVNEHAWASNFFVKVLDDGSVYLDVEDDIRHFAGSQPWPEHNKYGDVLIECVEDGCVLHIFGKDL